MRHQSSTRHFNRDSKARRALILSLVSNLAERGEIVTTKPMAKEAARHMDKLIVRAKQGDIASSRVLHRFFGKRNLTNRFIKEIAPALSDRTSGFTTMSYYGHRRGDNAELFTLKFVNEIPARDPKTKQVSAQKVAKTKKSSSTSATAKAKKAVKAEKKETK